MAETCIVCGRSIGADRLVLVRGNLPQVHCSESCLRDSVRMQGIARRKERRWFMLAVFVALLPAGGNIFWRRYHAPRPVVIVADPPAALPNPPAVEPVQFGPAWPPTDADWMFAFSKSSWTFPLPGPNRRPTTSSGPIFGPLPPANHPARCRQQDLCGVDLGGQLWGEHVYAAHDGVVEHVQSAGNDERGGQYVRISHFGGMVFTQYFHLAATPRLLVRGVRVKAGDVIGLVGDTGLAGARRHLHFTLSIRPTNTFSEVYWDPSPLMATWPLHIPPHGTVAGFALADKDREMSRHRHLK